jgi:outer membrane protein TolC
MKQLFIMVLLAAALASRAADNLPEAGNTNRLLIDLPTVLRLAGAQNLDVQIAQQRVAEARANRESSTWRFFPSITPGASYRRHDDLIQDVAGNIIDVHKQAYTVGPSLDVQLQLGDAIYHHLAARQLEKASDHALETQRQDSLVAAANGYFDLAKARAAVQVASESVSISTNYTEQIRHGLDAGIAFKGDLLRVQVQGERDLLALQRAQAQEKVASARLVETLHLEGTVELVPAETEPIKIQLFSNELSLNSLVTQALSHRPELKQRQALAEAARDDKNGAVYGPIIPNLGAQVFAGGLGGGIDNGPKTFGASEDYVLTLGWKIGPGGLFDRGRIKASESRLKVAELTTAKQQDQITRQVVENVARVRSLFDQVATTQRAIEAAQETLQLSRERKDFAVGVVLEVIQAEQELTRARLDYLSAVSDFNSAQYELAKAVGGLSNGQSPNGGSKP